MDGLVISNENSARFDHALQRLAATSKKDALTVMKQQAKLLFKEVALITPPGGGARGQTLKGRAAEQAGKLAIVSDHHQLYGMPGRAYDDLAKKDQAQAGAFWSAFKNNRLEDAGKIVRANLGKSFVPFDGGKAARGFLGKKRKKEALFYITDPAAMSAHIKQVQTRVWFLASGWSQALRALGVPLPYGVGKQSGPGLLKVEINDTRLVITMTNQVRYARQVKNLEAQIRFAMGKRADTLERMWNDYLARLSRGGLSAP